jgi:hypothetical protein
VKIIRPMTIDDAAFVSSNITEADEEVWSSTKYYAAGDEVMVTSGGEHRRYEALLGTAVVVTMTIATPCVITWTGSAPAVDTPFQLSTTGALPTGLVAGTTYYVRNPSGSTSNVSATAGGANINTTGSQSGVHTARHGANLNKTPSLEEDYWLDVGATNRWKMWDGSVNSQSTRADEIEVVLQQSERVNAVALLNISASEVNITVTDPTDGVVYDETTDLVWDSGVADWYAYFFEPIIRRTDFIATDLPAYATAQVTVTLTDTGDTVALGEMVLGLSREIGSARYGSTVSIQDYSIKEEDDFGNFTVLERAYARRASFPVWVEGTFTDELVRLLTQYRATPVVWVGIDHLQSTFIYGFFRDFQVEIAYPTVSLCSLEIDGLT